MKEAKTDDPAARNKRDTSKKKEEITERLEAAKKAYFEAQGKLKRAGPRERMVSISRELFNWVEGNEKENAASEQK